MIRKFNEQDIDEIMTIWLEANISAHIFVDKNYWEKNYDTVKNLLPKASVYVFEENNNILGFIGLANNHIEGLFVKKMSRGKGIGKKLLNFVKDNKQNLTLKVYKDNERAVKFYLSEGFIITSQQVDSKTEKTEYIMNWKNKMQNIEIRKILLAERNEAINLIKDVFMKFEAPDYSDNGINSFFATALYNNDFLNNLVIYGAFINTELVGVIATRNGGSHISLFFVKEDFHRQGIGRKLFNTVLSNSKTESITVNSSPYAKEVYHKLGFTDLDIEQTVDGIRFVPMEFRK